MDEGARSAKCTVGRRLNKVFPHQPERGGRGTVVPVGSNGRWAARPTAHPRRRIGPGSTTGWLPAGSQRKVSGHIIPLSQASPGAPKSGYQKGPCPIDEISNGRSSAHLSKKNPRSQTAGSSRRLFGLEVVFVHRPHH